MMTYYGDTTTSWEEVAKNGIYTGVIAGAAASLLFGESGTQDFFGINLPAPVTAGVAAGIGSVGADLTSKYVLETLGQDPMVTSIESTVVRGALAGAATSLALNVANGAEMNLTTFALGGISAVAGKAVTDSYDPLSVFY